MAVNENKPYSTSATSRHWFFGANVMVLIVLVVFLVVVANYLGQRYNARADLSAGGLASYRLSQRTQNIVKQTPGDIQITTVYTSDEPDYDRKVYFPRLRDLCDEMAQADKRVKVQHLHTGADRAELRSRIQGKFGTAAEKHEAVVKAARELWGTLNGTVGSVQQEIDTLQQDPRSWLSNFSTLARISAKLKANLKEVQETGRELDNLVGGEGIPRFQEATNKIKTVDDQLKQTLEETQKWCKDTNSLVTVLSNKDSEFATKTRKQLEEGDKLLDNLAKSVGDPSDQTVPDDPRPAMQEFAKASVALSRWLNEEVSRVKAFVKANPAIEQHPRWMLSVPMGPFMAKMPLSANLNELAQSVSQNVQQVRQILAAQDAPKDQLQGLLRQLREIAANLRQKVDQEWKASILAILDDGARIDPKSKEFLARGSDGKLFKEPLDKLADIGKKIDALPKLELDEIANRLQEDNLVVIEVGNQVQVVKFDEVWPISDPTAQRFRMNEKQTTARVFDGDSAIASALLSMSNQKKFATVVFVGYETEGDPRMRQMGQGRNTGRIPLDQLSTLKEKLKQANFAVGKDWNLGAEGEEAKPPQPEEGTDKIIYVFLPPAEAPPANPYSGQPPPKGFGEQQLNLVKQRLTAGSKAIFLAAWEMPRMSWMGPEPSKPYAYDDLLGKDYGIDVHQDYRLIRVVPDERDPDRYSIDIEQIGAMQLSSFTDQPIGAPLKSRRMLMTDVCPVTRVKGGAEPLPEGVTVTPILEVPATFKSIWAEQNEGIGRISDALRTGENRGEFSADPKTTWLPPFSVILAAEKSFAKAEDKARVVVMGNGESYADYYITRRVPRFTGEGRKTRFMTDPPPVENAELFINTVYWLNGQQGMIAEGPAAMPLVPALKAGTQTRVLAITVGWAFAVLVAGGVVLLVRRK